MSYIPTLGRRADIPIAVNQASLRWELKLAVVESSMDTDLEAPYPTITSRTELLTATALSIRSSLR